MSIQQVLKNSSYHLALFSEREIAELEKKIATKQANGKTIFYVRCLIRDKDIRLKPEEVVRQLYLRRLLDAYGYPKTASRSSFP
jgi:type I restriction enzyme M protein